MKFNKPFDGTGNQAGIFSFLLTLLVLLISNPARATTRTAVADGGWGTAATWSPSGVPVSGDDIIIPSGITVTLGVVRDLRGPQITVISVWGTLDFNLGGIRLDNVDGDKIQVMSGGTIAPEGWVFFGNEIVPSITISNTAGFPSNGPMVGPITLQNSVIPIELISFAANTESYGVDLNWSTASEKNFDFFQIERASDGISFETIGTVSGAGFSTTRLYYSFVDEEVRSGKFYYRLKNVDRDGSFEYSNIVSIEKRSANWVSVYPNPLNSDQTVEIAFHTAEVAPVNMSMVDMHGRPVSQSILQQTKNQVSLGNNVPTGVYLLRLASANRQEVIKIVVQ